MTPLLVAAQSMPAQPWRNGGGQTRQLLTWPAQGSWRLRISRADIEADGPFSAYPGVTRWFTVLQGAGVTLTMQGAPEGPPPWRGPREELLPNGAVLCFDGASAPACRLLDGPTQDLNLMAVGGSSTMTRAVPGLPWNGPWQMRGLYTPVAGLWRSRSGQCTLQADTLLWQWQAAAADPDWIFTPHASGGGGNAWWLGFTP